MSITEPILQVNNLCIEQGGQRVWDGFSLSLTSGERLGISAPSGFGKTTLGRVLAQWQKASQGTILFEGQPLPQQGYCPIQLVPNIPKKALTPIARWGRVYLMLGSQKPIG